jgi:hypothetical protein
MLVHTLALQAEDSVLPKSIATRSQFYVPNPPASRAMPFSLFP